MSKQRSTKIPEQLDTYPEELFGVLQYAHEVLIGEHPTEPQLLEVAVTGSIANSAASRVRFRLNQLRKSLDFWAPNSELAVNSQNLMFTLAGNSAEGSEGVQVIAKHRKKSAKAMKFEQIPGLIDTISKVEVPKPEISIEEVERKMKAFEDREEDSTTVRGAGLSNYDADARLAGLADNLHSSASKASALTSELSVGDYVDKVLLMGDSANNSSNKEKDSKP